MASNSNLPTVQRLKYEDYARAGNWQEATQLLVNALNLFITPTYDILNGGVTYSNLTAPKIYTTVVTAGATTTFSFVNPLLIQPQAVVLGNVWSGIRSNHPAVVTQAYWHIEGNTIVVDNVIGLTSGTQYSITLVIL